MSDKATHALVTFREDERGATEVFAIPRPTTDRDEAVRQWENSAVDYNDQHPGHERFIMDLTLLAPGQEKATPAAAPVPSALLPKRRAEGK